jgi:bis(5'-adenosyl)-triphosphatase
VLVCSTRPAQRITNLHTDELAGLMCVQRVERIVERAYKSDRLTIACQVQSLFLPLRSDKRIRSITQDGLTSGQTVPHVHFHILPRRLQGDLFTGSEDDAVYIELERRKGALPYDLVAASEFHTDSGSPGHPLRMGADAAREPRTHEDMEQEARWLVGFCRGGLSVQRYVGVGFGQNCSRKCIESGAR